MIIFLVSAECFIIELDPVAPWQALIMAAGAIALLHLLHSFKRDDLLPAFKLSLDVETHCPQGEKQRRVRCV